jgi:hypothetical protein
MSQNICIFVNTALKMVMITHRLKMHSHAFWAMYLTLRHTRMIYATLLNVKTTLTLFLFPCSFAWQMMAHDTTSTKQYKTGLVSGRDLRSLICYQTSK